MDKTPNKARRIEAELRLKARALRRLRPSLEAPRQPMRPIEFAKTAGKLAQTRTPCSCAMCGNPRRHAKGANRETLAESRARLVDED